MITVTFTDLRNHAKKYFDAVARGETIEVYRHGKPAAVLSPPKPSASDYWKRVKPLPIRLKGMSLTEALLADREESS